MSKFERLMELFAKWSAQNDSGRGERDFVLRFYPDGSGQLSKHIISTVLEFADIDEVIAYLQRRVSTPVSIQDEIEAADEEIV